MSAPLKLHAELSGAGPPVMILHGLFGSTRNWQSVARRLAAEHAVYTVDLRNHGRSPHADTMDYGEMAGDVRALIADLGLTGVALVGHSLGGKVAMTLVLDDPPPLAHLVIVDIAPVAYAERYDALLDAMESLPVGAIVRRAEADARLAPAIPDDGLRAFLLQNLVIEPGGTHWRVHLRALRAAMPALAGAVPNLAGHRYAGATTFIRGGRSPRILPEHAPLIARHFPQHEILTLPEAGHWPHTESPAAFLELLGAVLGRAGRTAARH